MFAWPVVSCNRSQGDGVFMMEPHELGPPPAQGLYDPRHEHDACGVGFVVDIKGRKSHAIVRQALQVLINLLHRGACGCEPNTGDGAGILLQMPDKFLRRECDRLDIRLPGPQEYGAGLVFLPRDLVQREKIQALIQTIVAEQGQRLLGWRDVPTDDQPLGASARAEARSEEHTSELQSLAYLVCRLLLEKKKNRT